MTDVDKAARKQCKSVLTKEINRTRRFVAEDDYSGVETEIGKLKELFKSFETAHDKYHAALEEEDELDASDLYFAEVQENYISTMKTSSAWLKTKPTTPTSGGGSDLATAGLISAFNMPRVELECFDGDPLKYHSFLAVFDEQVHKATHDEQVKLTRLLQYTTGKAKDAIRSCVLSGSDGYALARDILQKRFGSKHLVQERIIGDLRRGKAVRTADELQCLADELTNCYTTLVRMGALHEVDGQACIVGIVERLQPYLRTRWRREAMELKRKDDRYPTFKELVTFVVKEADEAMDPVYGQKENKSVPQFKAPNVSSSFSTSAGNLGYEPKSQSCVLCNESHRLWYCQAFKNLRPAERLEVVRSNRLCENCLLANHATVNCRKLGVCTVQGCGQKHTKFIHVDNPRVGRNSSGFVRENQPKVVNASASLGADVHMPVVSVKVNDYLNTCALLDTASSNSFCSRSVVQALGLQGSTVTYELSTLSQPTERKTTELVDLRLTSHDGQESLDMTNVYVVDDIPVRPQLGVVQQYSHLRDLPLITSPQQVHILLGQDNSEALIPMDVRRGQRGEPYAIRTLFGWALNGPGSVIASRASRKVVSHFITANTVLENKLDKLWTIENEGMGSEEVSWSPNDRGVIDLWDSSVKIVDNHYQLPIPWKPDVVVPDNRFVAESRLRSLKSSLIKKGLLSRYGEEIGKLVRSGFAERVAGEDEYVSDPNHKVWYLPHHAVITEKKPDKVRIVYDCAAKFQGESLNDKCYQGPDLNNKLLHVLTRFRQFQYAVMADVENMYYQVLIPVEDRDVLRFLWFDPEDRIVVYRMTRHVFGGVWCASSSTYALRRTVTDNADVSPLVADTIRSSFYVDDCLKSVTTVQDALAVINGTRDVLRRGGFRLTKFVVNSDSLLSVIPEEERAKEVKEWDQESNSKALGIRWNVSSDEFFFDVGVGVVKPITRRIMLSVISSAFDPLGLVGPVVVGGRILFQDATRLGLSWDACISGELEAAWNAWIRSLADLEQVRIPRCVVKCEFVDAFLELHHFSDASERAYGCCTYLRSVNRHGRIEVSLLISRSKVAPIKSITIPRLELQAAVLSAQMDSVLRKELSLGLGQSYFWVDSELVVHYVKNDELRLHTFVANRVSAIRSLTRPDQWHHISGSKNPADIISRGVNPVQLQSSEWFTGPEFLRQYKSQWRVTGVVTELSEQDPEVKREVYVSCQVATEDAMDKLFSHYSEWYRLRRAVAWLLRVKSNLSHRDQVNVSKQLSIVEMKKAEKAIILYVQGQVYHKEMKQIFNGQTVNKSSSLHTLNPVMDEDGLLRVGGRIARSGLGKSQRQPYLIPHSHAIATLIAREHHEVAHLGTEWVVSVLRQRFWITRIRKVLGKISHSCMKCRKCFASPCVQKMADLPVERLESNKPPFTFVGIDCFGPFYVKRARSEIKRYGCVFTCFTTRAVHLEKLDSLDTDSFLNGFRRFVARRGNPESVWSDNATNFVGGKGELDRSLSSLDKDLIRSYSLKKDISWNFNPPGASHMGGVWERMIRTIRKVLVGLLSKNVILSDESLSTLFCEVEAIVNSRPITRVSNDVKDSSPLTPNHLLLLRESPNFSPGVFHESDRYKKRWRCVQNLADQFWRKWLAEYVPQLQRRSKWTKVSRNVREGDLVLVCGENTPRGLWPMGVVKGVNVGVDGLVRSVKVKTRSTELVRPVTKVVLLEGSND